MNPDLVMLAKPQTDTAKDTKPGHSTIAQATPGDPGFGIYVHWPFCAKKCPYCDFNSHVRAAVDHPRWRQNLVAELHYFATLTPNRPVTSVFFGGGTPSLMEPATVAAVVQAIYDLWPVTPGIEITLEANPTSVEASKFSGFSSAGINRVSLGVQALNDRDLAFLGRQHSAQEALKAVTLARQYFDRVSFDLIYARPGQTVAEWRAELSQALAAGCDHLSAYQLTIEQGTAFYTQHERGDFVTPGDELSGDLFEATQEVAAQAGLPAYEISNHAKPGEASHHNLTYWRYGDYVGAGPGAHGRLTLADGRRVGTKTHRAPEIWLERVEKMGHASKPFEVIAPEEQVAEYLMMGLRLVDGIAISRAETLGQRPFDQLVNISALATMVEQGLAEKTADHLALTAPGRQRLNAVLGQLLA